MYVANVSDYDNTTEEYKDSFTKNNICTNNENTIDINIPTLLLTITCGLSILCLKINIWKH